MEVAVVEEVGLVVGVVISQPANEPSAAPAAVIIALIRSIDVTQSSSIRRYPAPPHLTSTVETPDVYSKTPASIVVSGHVPPIDLIRKYLTPKSSVCGSQMRSPAMPVHPAIIVFMAMTSELHDGPSGSPAKTAESPLPVFV